MFFLLNIVFGVLEEFLKPVLVIAAAIIVAQILGIDVITMVEQFIQTQLQNAVSPF